MTHYTSTISMEEQSALISIIGKTISSLHEKHYQAKRHGNKSLAMEIEKELSIVENHWHRLMNEYYSELTNNIR